MHQDMAPTTLAEMLHGLWPKGVPQDELELHARLPLDARDTVLRRLNAIRRFEGETGEPAITAKDAASEAGVSVPRLYALASAWRSSRSIAALGRFAAERVSRKNGVRSGAREVDDDLVQKVVKINPDIGVAAFIEIIHKATQVEIPRSTARRLIIEARRRLPPQPVGRRLIFDSVGLDVLTDGRRMRLFAIIDDSSGLVLGWATASNLALAWGHLAAARNGLVELSGLDLTSFGAWLRPTTVEIRAQEADGAGCEVLSTQIITAGIDCVTTFDGLGRKLIETVGERFGGLWAGVGERDDHVSYRTARRARLPEFDTVHSLAIDRTMRDHNEARRIAAVQVDAGENSIYRRNVDDTKNRIVSILGTVAGSEAAIKVLPGYSGAERLEVLAKNSALNSRMSA